MKNMIKLLFLFASITAVGLLSSCKKGGDGWIDDYIYKNETSYEVKLVVDTGYGYSTTEVVAPNEDIQYRSTSGAGNQPLKHPKVTLIFSGIKKIEFDSKTEDMESYSIYNLGAYTIETISDSHKKLTYLFTEDLYQKSVDM